MIRRKNNASGENGLTSPTGSITSSSPPPLPLTEKQHQHQHHLSDTNGVNSNVNNVQICNNADDRGGRSISTVILHSALAGWKQMVVLSKAWSTMIHEKLTNLQGPKAFLLGVVFGVGGTALIVSLLLSINSTDHSSKVSASAKREQVNESEPPSRRPPGRHSRPGPRPPPRARNQRRPDHDEIKNTDEIDYKDYRLGDFFYLYYLDEEQHYYFSTFKDEIGENYPGTVAYFYFDELDDSPKYGYRNITILSHSMERFKAQHANGDLDLPSPTELVIHLRLADTMTDPVYTDVNRTVEDLWTSEDGFINLNDGIKYNYNEEEWKTILSKNMLDRSVTIDKITIVGSDVRRTIDAHKNRNQEYTELVTNLLQEGFPDATISHFKARNPDRALVFMASANWLIVGNGGFGQMAKAIVNHQRPHHAFSDLFGCNLVAADDNRLTPTEREFFEHHYVDTEGYFQEHFGHPWPQFVEKFM